MRAFVERYVMMSFRSLRGLLFFIIGLQLIIDVNSNYPTLTISGHTSKFIVVLLLLNCKRLAWSKSDPKHEINVLNLCLAFCRDNKQRQAEMNHKICEQRVTEVVLYG